MGVLGCSPPSLTKESLFGDKSLHCLCDPESLTETNPATAHSKGEYGHINNNVHRPWTSFILYVAEKKPTATVFQVESNRVGRVLACKKVSDKEGMWKPFATTLAHEAHIVRRIWWFLVTNCCTLTSGVINMCWANQKAWNVERLPWKQNNKDDPEN